jgi:hypothetical protein
LLLEEDCALATDATGKMAATEMTIAKLRNGLNDMKRTLPEVYGISLLPARPGRPGNGPAKSMGNVDGRFRNDCEMH